MPANVFDFSLSIKPLGAGDLIDRAIRFYRNNFWTFVLIAAPPVIIGTLISIGWTILGRELFDFGPEAVMAQFYSLLFTYFGNIIIWFFESVGTLIVMGGASRNFVRHILFGEQITFRETYANVRSRLFSLTGASILLIVIFTIFGWVIAYLGFTVLAFLIIFIVFLTQSVPFLTYILSAVVSIACIFGVGWLFFLLISRFAYVPQVITVEGQRVFAAVGRSTTLAGKNVKRLAALFIFTTVATYSALLLFYVPLGWYAYVSGVNLSFFTADTLPAWYEIASQLISQASLILLMPVWMIGLCLLYVDERVRREGYDIELMAARSLGEIPALPQNYSNPLQPAVSPEALIGAANQPPPKSSLTTLKLN